MSQKGDAPRHRQFLYARGEKDQTLAQVKSWVAGLDPEHVLWVEDEAQAKRHLGQSFDAVILDFHHNVNADLLGQCQGMVWGGGALILRLPPKGRAPDRHGSPLAVWPHPDDDVTSRLFHRLESTLEFAATSNPTRPLAGVSHSPGGSEEQNALVLRLKEAFSRQKPQHVVVTADRGRGKSSALGLALKDLSPHQGVIVTSAHRAQVREVFRHAGWEGASAEKEAGPWVSPDDLLSLEENPPFGIRLIVVDEAAQLSVPLLYALVKKYPDATFAFATTIHGYEGTGRGFSLRFLEWLKKQDKEILELSLETPIRWDDGDPLEAALNQALILDAEPAALSVSGVPNGQDVEHRILDRDALIRDEQLLRAFFGLLVHAHYRTTPSDLHRILDAPNIVLHALFKSNHPVAATLIAKEGALPAQWITEMAAGKRRIRGHALPDTLISHCSKPEAGAMQMVRSVRIAVHPGFRRCGLGTRLIEAVHQHHHPDCFGTLFGASPELITFRRKNGYELVRVGGTRGARTGEPTAIMMRPVSDGAKDLYETLRAELARDLPLQLEMMAWDHDLGIRNELREAFLANLPGAKAFNEAEASATVAAYAHGPRTFHATAAALSWWLKKHPEALKALEKDEVALIQGRLERKKSWQQLRREAGLPSISATMRAMRRALARAISPAGLPLP
jgi:tRNA(Met) cytidine acetyltransferase